jgi:hypothetical protein
MRTSGFLGLLASALIASTLTGCSTQVSLSPEDDGSVADESALTSGTPIPVGTKLVTTSRVNFRSDAVIGDNIIRLLAKGSSVVVVNRSTSKGAFYNVKSGSDEGWIHGRYLERAAGEPPADEEPVDNTGGSGTCTKRRLRFSADRFVSVPASGSAFVWGGNATGGGSDLYSSEFLSNARTAKSRSIPVFAYLEGPCGDTGGMDDGERARCETLHNSFNEANAPGTSDSPEERWKPYTFKQLTESGRMGVDFCEIDNFTNNVTIPLNPIAREIKALFDAGKIHCQLVLKNVEAGDIDSLRQEVAPTPEAAKFIAPFHIFEADDAGQKSALDAAMVRLKGAGAKTIISTDTNHYGSAFTDDEFLSCQ